MTSLREVVNSMFGAPDGPRHTFSMEQIADGVIHVENPDDDHVYLVTVRQIPRTVLPLHGPLSVGALAGVPVQLVRITVANHIQVTLDAAPGPEWDAALFEFERLYRQWEQDSKADRRPPPAWPADQFNAITIAISDDVGTAYRNHSAGAGGRGVEFRNRRSFLPVPPQQAKRLTVRITPPEGTPVQAEFPLPLEARP